jgi:predicted AlkP superfamily pyrophosphatase or phosphodiesterase
MDQVGFQDLERFSSSMPTLSRMRREGADFPDVRIHYLPTFTAVSHTGVGTGAPPAVHGIVSNKIPGPDGRLRVVFRRPEGRVDPADNLAPTLADWMDRRFENRSLVLSQIYAEYAVTAVTGHGTQYPGGDRDIVVWHGYDGKVRTDSRWFRLPKYLQGRTSDDVKKAHHGRFLGFAAGGPVTIHQASWYAAWEADNMLEMMRREGVGQDEIPDLVSINLKSTDGFGHLHGHDHPGYREDLQQIDRFLQRAVKYLEKTCGRDGYLVAVTADHGLVPDDGARLLEGDYVAWLSQLLDRSGDRDGDGGVTGFFGGNLYLDPQELAEDGHDLEAVRQALLQDPAILHAWTENQVRARVPEVLLDRSRESRRPEVETHNEKGGS